MGLGMDETESSETAEGGTGESWACPACGAANPVRRKRCQSCYEPRPAGVAVPAGPDSSAPVGEATVAAAELPSSFFVGEETIPDVDALPLPLEGERDEDDDGTPLGAGRDVPVDAAIPELDSLGKPLDVDDEPKPRAAKKSDEPDGIEEKKLASLPGDSTEGGFEAPPPPDAGTGSTTHQVDKDTLNLWKKALATGEKAKTARFKPIEGEAWLCKACGETNAFSFRNCRKCFGPRPDMAKKSTPVRKTYKPTAIEKDAAVKLDRVKKARPKPAEGRTWKCKNCNAENEWAKKRCMQCFEERPPDVAEYGDDAKARLAWGGKTDTIKKMLVASDVNAEEAEKLVKEFVDGRNKEYKSIGWTQLGVGLVLTLVGVSIYMKFGIRPGMFDFLILDLAAIGIPIAVGFRLIGLGIGRYVFGGEGERPGTDIK